MRIALTLVALAAVALAAWWWTVDGAPADGREAAARTAGAAGESATGDAPSAAEGLPGTIGRFEPHASDSAGADPTAVAGAPSRVFDDDPGRTPTPPRDQGSTPGGTQGPSQAVDAARTNEVLRRDALDAEPEPEALEREREQVEEDLADLAEQLEFLPPDQLEARTQREMRRSGVDHDTARQTVLSDYALAVHLARQQAGPDASPELMQIYVDRIWGHLHSLSPEAKAQKRKDALEAL